MAEAGKEEKPKRCTCGFWGSPQTMDMCSKCYKEYIQKSKASKVEAGQTTNTEKNELLKQLGLVASSVNSSTTTSEVSNDEEKSDNQTEGEKREESDNSSADPFLPADRPQQKNKKKCWICKAKLELAQRELGSCKCGYVFCFLHRLPEQHDCIYDHKEGGRQQALKVMVPAHKKKIGRSFHRMDSRPE